MYQDLYGEGIFAGKGIYEVDTVHRVLDRRFPRNALLSHDLIEGAYARAGLASDIEIIEDYPSHYSAYNRRKHRWLRGDWQITGWLFSRVPDESGRKVPNPISLVSQWKILDNLRRSLVEPATFLLLVFGWLVLPGNPLYWTLATLGILFVPAWFQFLFNLVRAAIERKSQVVKDARTALLTANASMFFTLSFLPHQMLLSLDAVVRTLVRRLVTRRRLLEWETAAETEFSTRKRTPVDIYLDWMPALALALRRAGFLYPAPRFFCRASHPVALGLQQMDFNVAQSAFAGPAQRNFRQGRIVSGADRASHLAVFRRVQHGRAQLAGSRQCAGRTSCHCGTHFAHQPGLSSKCPPGGLRVWISHRS